MHNLEELDLADNQLTSLQALPLPRYDDDDDADDEDDDDGDDHDDDEEEDGDGDDHDVDRNRKDDGAVVLCASNRAGKCHSSLFQI